MRKVMKTTGPIMTVLVIFALLVLLVYSGGRASAETFNNPEVKIGDITHIQGIRDNQLMGYGLVIGLAGTGDGSRFIPTIQSLANVLKNMGIKIDSSQLRSKNVASVMVTATLPPFARSGDTIDVTVSSLGDAKSLQGGTLLLTPLRAPNGKVYAVAQGPLSIGGFDFGSGGQNVRENHPTVGRITGGAIVERGLDIDLSDWTELTLRLDNPDFETAEKISSAINKYFDSPLALAENSAQVTVEIPVRYLGRVVEFISEVHQLKVRPSVPARIVINERTGVIVMGHQVRISTVAVSYANLTVTISTTSEIYNPEEGEEEGEEEGNQAEKTDQEGQNSAIVIKNRELDVEKGQGSMTVLSSGPTIQDLVNALNAIGATPREIINIIQAIKAAGALHAEVVII